MIGPKGEKVCLISCSENNDQRGNVRSDNLLRDHHWGRCSCHYPSAPCWRRHSTQCSYWGWTGLQRHQNITAWSCLPTGTQNITVRTSPSVWSSTTSASTATHFRRWSLGRGAFLWPSWSEFVCLLTIDHPSAGWHSPHPGTKTLHYPFTLESHKIRHDV